MNTLVVAKTPVPGRVKTRLCPPCSPGQAARVAAAALADTLDTVAAAPAAHRTLVVEGAHPAPRGWDRVTQRGDGLGTRLAHAFVDTRRPGVPSLLVGMDTPQLTVDRLAAAAGLLRTADAVLGPAEDGGWWALGFADPRHAEVLRDIPTSLPTTGARTLAALRGRGLRVAALPVLRDVDTAADAHAVAALCPAGSRFAAAVARHVPGGARVGLAALDVYDAALTRAATGRRVRLTLRDDSGRAQSVNAAAWCRAELPGDSGLLDRCAGPTLDVGCGPGRLAGGLLGRGRSTLGIDVSAAAVGLARRRGVRALRRDVFAPVPGHGRWHHVLLADGNIGIGGAPGRLLRRCRDLLAPAGLVYVELAPPGTRTWAGIAFLSVDDDDDAGAPFRWASVATGDLAGFAVDAGLRVVEIWTEAGRWFASLAHG